MDSSYENTTTSLSEYYPLLYKPPTPLVNNRDTSRNLRTSIFTCAVVSILFTELCERLTFYGIIGNLVYFATERDHLNMSPADASILAYVFQGKPLSLLYIIITVTIKITTIITIISSLPAAALDYHHNHHNIITFIFTIIIIIISIIISIIVIITIILE